ncbi:myc box-dependent-interacting protein 1 isoform 2 [Anopheles sinensis]|uniref:Myc box-dependent-interacting protein 1 isoform 2 n=1 Tax=Anopheles sinensis TaxID=74873 RepID=A0A084VX31_ANOSI|nr:myc box-dependent-interacting protein 1 isoform 2 [Anopheles sinensis]
MPLPALSYACVEPPRNFLTLSSSPAAVLGVGQRKKKTPEIPPKPRRYGHLPGPGFAVISTPSQPPRHPGSIVVTITTTTTTDTTPFGMVRGIWPIRRALGPRGPGRPRDLLSARGTARAAVVGGTDTTGLRKRSLLRRRADGGGR